MLEIPEAAVVARQLNDAIYGKAIVKVVAGQNPHSFSWYAGEPSGYGALLIGKKAGKAAAWGGMVEIEVEDTRLLFGDGVNLRFCRQPEDQPAKHQLLVIFDDGSSLAGTVAMYGGLWCFRAGAFDNPYYLTAMDKPSPLKEEFDEVYFGGLFSPGTEKLSMKAFLATEQRIPGLGNGVLQDILYQARMHPKSKVSQLGKDERKVLFGTIKATLGEMTSMGGRDTERDLFGNPGGYTTRMSRNTVGKACPACGEQIQKQAYMGGSIYFCPGCQAG